MTVTVHIDLNYQTFFYDFILFLSFVIILVSIEKIYINHSRQCAATCHICLKTILCYMTYFQFSSQCLEMWSNAVFCFLYITTFCRQAVLLFLFVFSYYFPLMYYFHLDHLGRRYVQAGVVFSPGLPIFTS